MNVAFNLRDDELRLRAMHHCEDGVTMVQQGLVALGVNGFMAGKESAADHEKNAFPIGIGRLKNVERQRRAILPPVNDILGAFVFCLRLSQGGTDDEESNAEQGDVYFHG